MTPEPREVVQCPVGRGAACEPVERVFRAMAARDEGVELRLVNHFAEPLARHGQQIDALKTTMIEGFKRIEDRLDELAEEQDTGMHTFGRRLSRTEAESARSSAVAEAALSETAKLGRRQGRRKGQLETGLVAAVVALTYALARALGAKYGFPVP